MSALYQNPIGPQLRFAASLPSRTPSTTKDTKLTETKPEKSSNAPPSFVFFVRFVVDFRMHDGAPKLQPPHLTTP